MNSMLIVPQEDQGDSDDLHVDRLLGFKGIASNWKAEAKLLHNTNQGDSEVTNQAEYPSLPKEFKFRCNSEAHNKAIQEHLFGLGYGWRSGQDKTFHNTDKTYLCVGSFHPRQLEWHRDIYQYTRDNKVEVDFSHLDPAFNREANQAWVPEVGEECEIAIDGLDFMEGKALAFHEDMVWIDYNTRHPVRPLSVCKFRPLPTAEDKAVEEMLKDVDECIDPDHDFRALYRKGWRKQEAQPDMSDPKNWRAGDLLFCYRSNTTTVYTPGSVYAFKGWTEDGKLDVTDNWGGESSCHIFPNDSTLSFRFHCRP